MSKEKVEREAALLKEELHGGNSHSFLASRSQTSRALGSLSLTLGGGGGGGGGDETVGATTAGSMMRSPMGEARQRRREERRQRREAEEHGGRLTREEIKLRHYESVLKKLQHNSSSHGQSTKRTSFSSSSSSRSLRGAPRLSSLQQARQRFDMLSSSDDD